MCSSTASPILQAARPFPFTVTHMVCLCAKVVLALTRRRRKRRSRGSAGAKVFLLHYMCSPCFEAEVSEDERQSWLLFEEPLFEKPLLLHLVFPHPLFVYWRRFTAYRPLSYDGAFPYNTDVLPRSGIAMSVSSESSAAERKSSQQVPSGNFTVGSADVNVTVNEAFDGFAI
jgi:hypothetical protein